MNPELFIVLVISGFNLILAYLIISASKKKIKRGQRYFFFLLISLSIWAIITYYEEEPISQELVRLLVKFDFAFASLLAMFFNLFSINFPLENRIKSVQEKFILLLGSLAAVLAFTTFYVSDITFFDGGIRFIRGPGFIVFFIYFVIALGQGVVRLLEKRRVFKGLEKLQILYVLFGLVVSGIIGVVTNLVLPPLGFDSSFVSRFGIYGILIFNIVTTISVIKHRLLDIRYLVTRSVVYGLLVTVVALLFIFIVVISAQFFDNSAISRNGIAFIISILIVFGLDPLKRVLSGVTDNYFFKAAIDYQSVLRKLSESVSFQLDLELLIRELRGTLREELKLKFVATLLRRSSNGTTEEFVALDDILRENKELHLANASPLISYLRAHRHPAVLDSLQRKIDDTPEHERAPFVASQLEFERMGAALVSPVYAQNHLIAVLVLGPKLSGDTFSSEDLNLIEVLSPQIGSAIQKANLYEEVKQFSEGLKAKVDAATSELLERNTSLQTLQHITKEITRTLDFNQVVQQIADSVSTELGYLGAILVFLDDDMRTVRARAITQTPLTKKAMDMLPVKFAEYTSDLSDSNSTSLGHQVLRSGQMMVTAHFAQVISPPLPKLLAQGIQKILGMKTMVVVPINSEGKTIGCIQIGLDKRQEDISKQEFDTMFALADELGVVYRNIKLFDRIQMTNQQLEVANAHLQQLDQAKSEFVSIASHQLRTPMTGIMGYLSMMTSGDFGKIAPEHQKILASLLAESQRMIRLINQFLNVSKIEAGKFTFAKKQTQLLDLAKQEVQELLHVAKDKKLQLLTEFSDQPLPDTVADPDKIQDVMLNLIDNAIKYTASGTVTVGLNMKGPDLHFYVRDTGIGITPVDAKELFNKFVRGSGIAQIHPDGSGLGLFIAKSIIDAHEGKIWVESEGEGKGSTFQFTLPVIHTDPGKEKT